MIVLPYMGLVKWDSINDYFSHEQLAANFGALDAHDHTPGKGKQIPAGGLAEQSVEPQNLTTSVYTQVAEHIAPETITTTLLKNGAVTSPKFKPTSGIIPATGNLQLTESYADIPGVELSITPTVASTILVWTVTSFTAEEGSFATIQTSVKLDANAEQTAQGRLSLIPGEIGNAVQQYRLALTATSHTLKLRAKRSGLNGGEKGKAQEVMTTMMYMLVAS